MPRRFPHVHSRIPGYPRSVALLSAANQPDVTGAVIFVHGFSGAARSTWTDFFSLIDDPQTNAWWETRDIYFYHYWWNSVFQQVPMNAFDLRRFVKAIFPSPPRELFEAAEVSLR